jgi:REP element-mobilizing transposase RayT
VVDNNKYHAVWCLKYKRKLLKGKIAVRLRHILVAKRIFDAQVPTANSLDKLIYWVQP